MLTAVVSAGLRYEAQHARRGPRLARLRLRNHMILRSVIGDNTAGRCLISRVEWDKPWGLGFRRMPRAHIRPVGYNASVMTKVIQAIYANGVLKPTEALELSEQQRVRLIVQTEESPTDEQRKAALQRLFDRIDRMNFRLRGPLPTRDELHERR